MERWERLFSPVRSGFVQAVFQTVAHAFSERDGFAELQGSFPVAPEKGYSACCGRQDILENIAGRGNNVSRLSFADAENTKDS